MKTNWDNIKFIQKKNLKHFFSSQCKWQKKIILLQHDELDLKNDFISLSSQIKAGNSILTGSLNIFIWNSSDLLIWNPLRGLILPNSLIFVLSCFLWILTEFLKGRSKGKALPNIIFKNRFFPFFLKIKLIFVCSQYFGKQNCPKGREATQKKLSWCHFHLLYPENKSIEFELWLDNFSNLEKKAQAFFRDERFLENVGKELHLISKRKKFSEWHKTIESFWWDLLKS